jgi:hypothetical protein
VLDLIVPHVRQAHANARLLSRLLGARHVCGRGELMARFVGGGRLG